MWLYLFHLHPYAYVYILKNASILRYVYLYLIGFQEQS